MRDKNSDIVRGIAYDLGFQYCGISKADFLQDEAPRLETWLKEQKHGKMSYMENHFDMRLDPRLLVPGAKSVVSLLLNYFPEMSQRDGSYQVSKYAFGKDYHDVIRAKLKVFLEEISRKIGAVEGRVFVDSAPVMDKAWAKKAGLGWMGKNTNLIHPKAGSFFFIAELIIDLELEADGPIKDYCGTCTRCLDACPTEALTPYQIDANRCISYLTIELKDELINPSFSKQLSDWIFGCDICQDVCPWNRFSKAHTEPLLMANSTLLNFTKEDWENLDELEFTNLFKGSPIKRTKFQGLKRNITASKKGHSLGE